MQRIAVLIFYCLIGLMVLSWIFVEQDRSMYCPPNHVFKIAGCN